MTTVFKRRHLSNDVLCCLTSKCVCKFMYTTQLVFSIKTVNHVKHSEQIKQLSFSLTFVQFTLIQRQKPLILNIYLCCRTLLASFRASMRLLRMSHRVQKAFYREFKITIQVPQRGFSQELDMWNSLIADGHCAPGKLWRRGFERKAQQFAHRT